MPVALLKIRMEKGYFSSFLFAQNDFSILCFQIAIVSGGVSEHKDGKAIELLTTEILNIDRGSGWTIVGSLPVAARIGPRIGNLGNTLYLTGMEDNAGDTYWPSSKRFKILFYHECQFVSLQAQNFKKGLLKWTHHRITSL